VSDTKSPLSDDDVQQITKLVETLENSSFDFLQVEMGDLKVTLGKGDAPPVGAAPVAAPVPAAVAAAVPAAAQPAAPAPAPVPATPPPPTAPAEDGTVAITAPMLGRFYAQSEPGADPFVKVGGEVTEETTVALIEVMKLFTNVPANVRGTVTEVCVANEEMVEYGQVLFRVRPSGTA